ncbi:MAG: hypothetical protein JRI59_10180, partial [Deltaproteobacteria bacterium]|nr:hypothetical protein [Deltaproteobacteria bacterium]
EAERQAFEEAVKKAFRDTRLELASQVRAAFTAHVRRLVSMEMEDREFLRQCLLVIIGYATRDLPHAAMPKVPA